MRWNRKAQANPGETRLRRRFLWKPKRLPDFEGNWETRWLEFAEIIEVYRETYNWDPALMDTQMMKVYDWKPECWV